MLAIPRLGRSVHDSADHLDTDPERVELVAAAPAQVVVAVAAALVVEADPEAFLVLRQRNLQRLPGRQTLANSRPLRLEQEGVGVPRLRRQRQAGGHLGDREALGAGPVLPRDVAAEVDAAPGPDAHHVALADAAL